MKSAWKAAVKDSVKISKNPKEEMMGKVEHKGKKMHEMEKGEDMPSSSIKHHGGLEKVTLHGAGGHAYPHNKKLCKLGY
jgi:hypothetical protein